MPGTHKQIQPTRFSCVISNSQEMRDFVHLQSFASSARLICVVMLKEKREEIWTKHTPITESMKCAFKKNKNNKCQFEFTESDLINYNGEYYCEFHLPAKAKLNEATTRNDKTVKLHSKEFNDKIFRIIDEMPAQELINFCGVVFPHNIDFSKRLFTGKVDFTHATFCANVGFQETIFEIDSDFSYATFIGFPIFYKAQFSYVLFVGARFSEGADFRGATFGDMASFMGSIFNNAAYFSHATFKSDAIFSVENRAYHPDLSIKNVGKVDPEAEKFDAIFFDRVQFCDKADFVNRRFSSTTSFYKTVFKKAPMFHGCKLHQDTDFRNVQFLDLKSQGAARAYQVLNLAMVGIREREEAAKFYRYEQGSIRNDPVISKWVKFFSWCYEKTADYGHSVGRPAGWLFLNFIIFSLLYSSMASPILNIENEFDFKLIGKAFNLSFQQLVRPFGIWLNSGTGIANDLFGNNIGWIRFTASVQSLLNIVFVLVQPEYDKRA